MTKERICYTINAVNTNKHIVWTVAENTPEQIVLTNSYDKCVKLTIKVGEDCITVKDTHMEIAVECLFKGESRLDDYKDDADGIRLAIKAAVKYFNVTY